MGEKGNSQVFVSEEFEPRGERGQELLGKLTPAGMRKAMAGKKTRKVSKKGPKKRSF